MKREVIFNPETRTFCHKLTMTNNEYMDLVRCITRLKAIAGLFSDTATLFSIDNLYEDIIVDYDKI